MPRLRLWRTNEVYCSHCKEWYTESEVQFLNIEEDMEGRDILTFTCHVCNTQQRSLVRSR